MNSQEVVAAKFAEQKEEVRRRKANGIVVGSNHVVEGELVPIWEYLIGEEYSHDGDLMHDWDFAQKGVIRSNIQFKPITK